MTKPRPVRIVAAATVAMMLALALASPEVKKPESGLPTVLSLSVAAAVSELLFGL